MSGQILINVVLHHLVHDIDSFPQAICLKSDSLVALQQLLKRHFLFEIGALHRDREVRHRFRRHENCG